jgi:hypothetical protein
MPHVGRVLVWAIGALGIASACASRPPPPNVPPSSAVTELHRTAGPTVQDCGEAVETRDEDKCRVQPIFDCVKRAHDACRAAQGTHLFSTDEGDAVRVDYFVRERPGGACDFIVIEDRSRDPLAPKTPQLQICAQVGWKPHATIPACDVFAPTACATGS